MTWQNDDEATHIFGGNDPAVDAPWQVNVSETETRTMTAVEIGLEYGRGSLDANDTYVWREGMRDWAPLGQCPELVPVLAQFTAQRQRALTPPPAPVRVAMAPAAAPAPMFAPTPSFVPPRPPSPPQKPQQAAEPAPSVRPQQPSVPFATPPALSTGQSPLRGPMQSLPPNAGFQPMQGGFGGATPDGRASAPPGYLGASPATAPMPDFSAQAIAAAQLPEKRSSAVKMGLIVGGIVGVLGIGGATAFFLTRAPAEPSASASASPSASPSASADATKPASDPVADAGAGATAEVKAPAPSDGARPSAGAAPQGDSKKDVAATAADSKKDPKKDAAASAAEPKKDDPKKDAKGGGAEFSVDAARSALSSAASAASGCGRPNGPTGRGRATVTFAPSGSVASVSVDPPFAGTPVGSCAVAAFRGARVPAFSGSSQSVTKSFNIK